MVAEDVSKLAVFDDKSKSWIQYESLSDALIAKLYLEINIPTRYTDAFLRIIKNPQFDAQKLSFHTSMDIDRSIVEAQLARMSQRAACAKYPLTHQPRLSHDVFALIVDAIVQERPNDALFDDRAWMNPRRVSITKSLKALALTHRTITPLAQRALGQRLLIRNPECLCALTRSPLLGPWATELVISLSYDFDTSYRHETPGELVNYISAVLQRTPELKFLYIDTPRYNDDLLEGEESHLGRLLKAIRPLERLETLLWIVPEARHSVYFARLDLEDVCFAVNRMPRLRKLVLKNAQRGWIELDMGGDGEERTHHLKKLCLVDSTRPAGLLERQSLSWLLNGPSLQSLTLVLGTNRESIESILMASPALLRLHTLHLKFLLPPAPDVLFRIFASPTASSTSPTQKSVLHTLQLSLSDYTMEWTDDQIMSTSFDLSYVPRSVQSLQLHLLQINNGEVDLANCSAQEGRFIQFIENRRERLIKFKITRREYHRIHMHAWGRLALSCKSRGCRFELAQ